MARELERRDLRVLVAEDPTMLLTVDALLHKAWERQQQTNEEKHHHPLYLLVGEAQQSYAEGVLHSLLKMHPGKAEIPGKAGESAAFTKRIEPERVLLSEGEVCQDTRCSVLLWEARLCARQ